MTSGAMMTTTTTTTMMSRNATQAPMAMGGGSNDPLAGLGGVFAALGGNFGVIVVVLVVWGLTQSVV
jgi:hypothetical protein